MSELGEISDGLGGARPLEGKTSVIKDHFFRETSLLLFNDSIPESAIHLMLNDLWSTFEESREIMDIRYPIILRPSDMISDGRTLNEEPKTITMAFFRPTISNGEVESAELVLNKSVLGVYAQKLSRKNNAKPFTPWKLIGDVAHEMKHAGQYAEDIERVMADREKDYWSRKIELEAEQYAKKYISNRKPWGFMDYIERAFVIADLNKRIKLIRRSM